MIKAEIDKFEELASNWWKFGTSSFDMLHQMNPVRIKYIKQLIFKYLGFSKKNDLSNLDILDAGAGGGIATISLAKIGAKIDGIDAGEKNIIAAQEYKKSNDISNVNFICSSIEDFNPNKLYDVIICLEVLEHLENTKTIIAHLTSLLKHDGLIFISTLDKSYLSWLMSIVFAENILHFLPKNTHEYDKFISPNLLINFLEENNMKILDVSGINWLPNNFRISKKILSNYIISAQKIAF